MPMPNSHLSVLIPLYFFFLHHFILTMAVNFPAPYSPIDNLAINCGSVGNSTTPDGRRWIGDIGPKFSQLKQWKSKSVASKNFHQPFDLAHPVPYMTARISRSQFTYTFKVNPGPKFIRLHFYPVSYPGFERSKAFFTVKAGPYTLLSNFSASLTADALGLKSFVKEVCLNVDENQAFTITFVPSPSSTFDNAYAFVNGIEIVSMPTGLYHTQGAHVVGQNYRFYIENNTALEVVQRLNVGGSSISSVQDSGMFREWSEDSNYLIESGVLPMITTIPINYTSIPTYTAPQKVYQSTWSMGPTKQSNQMNNFTWKLPVDLGFRYLVRLHFCELEYGIKERGHRVFYIIINKQIAEAYADLIEWSGGNGVAVYRDYVVMMEGDRMEGKRDLLIALQPHCHDHKTKHDPILNGLEVFKLSNPDNNLAGPNPVSLADSRTSKAPKLMFAFDSGNVIVNGVIIFITLLNIVVYQLRIWAQNSAMKNISKSSPKEICRRFSFSEMQLATNNFDDAFTIGCGGFGKVYKGLINEGATTVAIKRLNSMSKQGAHEFWTEIEMLSQLWHTHLVTLIGYCDDCREMILVYEYMAQGTLADHIYKNRRNGDRISCLTLEQRLNICIGAARGLNYLHMGTHQRVIHRDVKSTNILLDENWVAKISDFGLSKMGITSQSRSYVSTNVKGTFGYLDPEYFSTRRLTSKSDVYAFGVVLLEVLCGRPAVDMRLEEEQHSLALWAQHCMRKGMIEQIIDPHLRTQISPRCLNLFMEVANKCLHNYSKDRPTMDHVVGSLELALASQESSGSCTEVEPINASASGADNEQFIDGIVQLGGADLQRIESPTFGQDITHLSRKRTKLTITKVVQSIVLTAAKGKDLQRKKAKDNSLANRSPWWRWFRHSAKNTNTKRLPAQLEDLLRHFSLSEVRAATNNFDGDLIIGHHYYHTLYKGYMKDENLVVVIGRLDPNSHWAWKCWEDLQIFAELRHPNILALIGYCTDEGEMILVHNFMGNGSLSDHLFGMDTNDPLPWKTRLEICIGAAQGLQYLHAGARQTVIHPNFKSCKILLDHDWVPKVSGIELSSRSSSMTCISSPNLDPESLRSGRVTDKNNVYSFGMVLLEVLSGCEASNLTPLHSDEMFLVGRFRSCIARKCIHHIIDPYLMGKIIPECFTEFVKILWSCLVLEGIRRPSMDDVVGRLQLALQLQECLGYHLQCSTTGASAEGAVAQAYNKALFNDTDFILLIMDEKSFRTATSASASASGGLLEMSCPSLDDPDYDSSNLAR